MARPMLHDMRRLHSRGAANRGICVDADGAMLGPDCILVRRVARGFRAIERERASALQKCLLDAEHDGDWLFRQTQRIAEALDKGEIALAQIYGLRIPIGALDDWQLERLSIVGFAKTFNSEEPRLPRGDPHGGEWTTGGDSSASTTPSASSGSDEAGDSTDASDASPIPELNAISPSDASSTGDAATSRGGIGVSGDFAAADRDSARIIRECQDECIAIFADRPGDLPGVGRNMPGRLRRCIRECCERHGCFDY